MYVICMRESFISLQTHTTISVCTYYKGNRVVHTKNRPLPHPCEQTRNKGVTKYSGLYRIDNISYSTVSLPTKGEYV